MNVQLNIANTDTRSIARWMVRRMPGIAFTATPAISEWGGELEEGVALQLWDVNEPSLDRLLDLYGADHPREEAFGVMRLTDSRVMPNRHHQRLEEAA